MASDKGFLTRWSERKLARQHGEPDPEAETAEPAAAPEGASASPPDIAEGEEAPRVPHPAEEIDIDALTRDSDFTVFMQQGVPKAVRQKALRKLWTSDPVLANLDGLNDYEDMERVYGIGPIGATAWKIGRGFLTDEEVGLNARPDAAGEGEAPPDEAPEAPDSEVVASSEEDAPPETAEDGEANPDAPPSGPDEGTRTG